MLQKYNRWRVLKVFFDDPNPKGAGFQLREISRKADLAPTSVKNYLNELCEKEGYGAPLVISSKHRIHGYPVYWANRSSEVFRFFKKIDMIVSIEESGLLNYLNEQCMPDVIILFGSASRGEDVRGSDIDLFLQCNKKKLDLEKYEKELKRKINLFFEKNFDKLSEELKTNIINGVKLKGYLRTSFLKWKKI